MIWSFLNWFKEKKGGKAGGQIERKNRSGKEKSELVKRKREKTITRKKKIKR